MDLVYKCLLPVSGLKRWTMQCHQSQQPADFEVRRHLCLVVDCQLEMTD